MEQAKAFFKEKILPVIGILGVLSILTKIISNYFESKLLDSIAFLSFLALLGVVLLTIILFWEIYSNIKQSRFTINMLDNINVLDNINEYGFEYHKSIYSEKKNKVFKVLWKEVNYCKLNSERNLIIEPIGNSKIIISKSSINWLSLLKQIPQSKQIDPQIPDYLAETFSDLKTCQVCGYIAYKNSECLNCRTKKFDKVFETEIEYMKEEQLDWFSAMDKEKKVDFYSEEENTVFKLDQNWKPIVTEEEVIAFSKENS
ncbi:MAG: hypothetical protein ACI85I_001380 [Arenicella sp.]|jgi:hypothetical protein